MARPWSEVVADPNFQALSPDAKESARNAYFQQNVLPNIPQGANAGAIRLKFDQDTVPTVTKTVPQTVYDAAEFKRRVGRDPENSYELAQFAANKGVGFAGDPTQGKFTAGQAVVGALEDATALGTGAIAAVPAGVTYLGSGGNLEAAKNVQNALTYSPRTQAGQAGLQGIGQVVSGPGKLAQFAADKADPTGNLSATLGDLGERAMTVAGIAPGMAALRGGLAAGAAGAVRRAANSVVDSVRDPEARAVAAQDVLNRAVATSPQSQGAAAAALQVNTASPSLQQAIVRAAQRNGGAVNAEAALRQLEADSLGLPSYTEGQATRDPALFSEEQNLRGKHTDLAEHFNQQNAGMVSKLQDLREQIGPDVFSTNQVEHGDTLIKAYQDIDSARRADIKAKYKALADANGGQLPVDGKTLVDNVDAALSKQYKARFLPREIRGMLDDFRDGPMTLEGYEALRTTLAADVRKAVRSGDGNAEGALNIVRNHVEDLPLENATGQVKALADQARAAAKARFDTLKADPAYKAAVDKTVDPDDFVKKFIINGSRDDVALMSENLAANDSARQTMAVSALDHLRDKAGVGADYKGSFKQAGYNKALQALDPKLLSLIDRRTAETLQALGNYAHNVQVEPVGATVNRSNTLSAGMADYASGALEHAVNAKAGGLPVGTLIGKVAQNVKYGSRVRRAIQPGAGIDQLKPITAYQQMLAAARAKAAQSQQVTP